jgi:hypothetical protein
MLNDTTIAALLETAGALAKIASTLAQLAAAAGRQAQSTATHPVEVKPTPPIRVRRLPVVEPVTQPEPTPTPPIRVRRLPVVEQTPVQVRRRLTVPVAPLTAADIEGLCRAQFRTLTGTWHRKLSLSASAMAAYWEKLREAATAKDAHAAYKAAYAR